MSPSFKVPEVATYLLDRGLGDVGMKSSCRWTVLILDSKPNYILPTLHHDMPRLTTNLLRHARSIDPLLTLLLHSCRDLSSAQNELRWLREHAIKLTQNTKARAHVPGWRALLRHLVQKRATGKPLQYVIGSEYFGDLEIICRSGVLIPR